MFAKFGFDSRTVRNNQTFFLSCESPKEAAFFQRFTSTRNRLSMNKTYKVIFSKVRGALMVCNEITSSVQKKGIQLVVATAGLVAMAGASAADVLTITGTPTTAGSLQKARIVKRTNLSPEKTTKITQP